MAATKSASTLIASVTNSSGGTTTQAASSDLTTDYGMFITARITNGATAPTIACSFNVEISNDDSNWRLVSTLPGGTGNNEVVDLSFIVDVTVMFARVVFVGNDDQDVTVEALGHILTGI